MTVNAEIHKDSRTLFYTLLLGITVVMGMMFGQTVLEVTHGFRLIASPALMPVSVSAPLPELVDPVDVDVAGAVQALPSEGESAQEGEDVSAFQGASASEETGSFSAGGLE